jgi:hypothetical protein
MGRLIRSTCLCLLALAAACAPKPAVTLSRDDAAGRLSVLVGGREAVVFQYGPDLDLVHYWPMRSPSGRSMLVQKTEPYPHHRSFWFADTVRPEGGERDISFYNGLYSGVQDGTGAYGPPFRDRIRLVNLSHLESAKARAAVDAGGSPSRATTSTTPGPISASTRRGTASTAAASRPILERPARKPRT